MPAAAKVDLAVVKFPPFVQAEPSYSSVAFVTGGGALPPIAKAAVCIPAPANDFLAVPIFPPVAQLAAIAP